MSKELELYQQEMDKAFKPILARFEHYKMGVNHIRLALKNYFLDAERTKKLIEPANTDQEMFNFNDIKDAMEMCFADEEVLNTSNAKGLMTVLDTHIAQRGLPLELQEDNTLYLFKPAKPYTPMAQIFMEQFAYALSAYRIFLGVYEVYSAVSYYKALSDDNLKQYIETIYSHTEYVRDDRNGDLMAHLKEVKYAQKEIKYMLRSEKVREGMEHLQTNINACSDMLRNLLDAGAIHLQNCYTKFPNNPILWMLHDRSWHQLLKTVSKLLYVNQYTYSTMYSSLQIKTGFIVLVKSEIDTFTTVVTQKTPVLKIELVKQAAKSIAETKIDILARMAQQGIEPPVKAKISFFPTVKSNNFYERMFDNRSFDQNAWDVEYNDQYAKGL